MIKARPAASRPRTKRSGLAAARSLRPALAARIPAARFGGTVEVRPQLAGHHGFSPAGAHGRDGAEYVA